MENIMNGALMPVINKYGMSSERMEALISLKEFLDRLCSKKHIAHEVVHDVEKKYGFSPNIITWGDYFQSELATMYASSLDSDLIKAVDTVKFDVISSYLIFNEQSIEFFEWVDRLPNENFSKDSSQEEQEYAHLKILKNYYVEMGIENEFLESEMEWYSSFDNAVAI